MSIDNPVARVNLDKAASRIITGAQTVFTNGDDTQYWTAIVGVSIMAGPPNKGDVIVQSPVTVFAENHKVAVQGAITARGRSVERGSPNVFAGANGPGAPVEIS
jgi:uncharacterized Zn-binding protein involved in type VI secretion